MQVFFSPTQLEHAPRQYMVAGRIVAPFEVPERAQRMADGLTRLGLDVIAPPSGLDTSVIAAVHDAGYLSFLETAHQRFAALPNAGIEVLPNVHPYVAAHPRLSARERPRTESVIGEAGWYMGDLSCAIGPGTWPAALASAQSAIAASASVLAGAEEAFALCRPPGHHAYADRCSGFCFLNNAALAAEMLRRRYARVAILDFDTHHGDGTQAIFFRRGDVFYGSVHTDPRNYYPFFLGYEDETGFGEGDKANLNIPLSPGSGDEPFIEACQRLIVAALAFGAQALVLSAGWDALREDPLSKLSVTADAFRRLGRLFGEIPLPTVIVQEGGYALTAIEEVAPSFIREFMDERRPR